MRLQYEHKLHWELWWWGSLVLCCWEWPTIWILMQQDIYFEHLQKKRHIFWICDSFCWICVMVINLSDQLLLSFSKEKTSSLIRHDNWAIKSALLHYYKKICDFDGESYQDYLVKKILLKFFGRTFYQQSPNKFFLWKRVVMNSSVILTTNV